MIALNQSSKSEDPGSAMQAVDAVLAKHASRDGTAADPVAGLQEWAERFIDEFKLAVSNALSVDPLPANQYGHYRQGHNGSGCVARL